MVASSSDLETAVFDHELFRFEGAEGAEYLFGEVIYPGLDDMLRRDEPILSATRDGLMWEYEALRPLRQALESRLADVVDAERRRRREEEAGTRNRELRDRVASAIRELNRIADAELIQVGGFGTGRGSSEPPKPGEPPLPESGFGFLYEFANVLIDKRASLLLRASADLIEPATAIAVAIDNPTDFELQTAQCVLEPRDDYPTVLEARVYVEGKRAGSECIVTASGAERQAEILCRVVTKQTPPRPPSGGLVNDVKFDSREDPLSRVRFDKETGNVFVSTKSPSVALYVSPNGDGAEQGEGAVLIAELVLEAVCREIARRGVEAGTFVAPEGGEAEAMQRVFANLQNKYGAVIHRCFAGPAPAGTRGRPTAREAAERAVVPV